MSIRIRRYKKEDIPLFYEAVKESLSILSIWLPWAHDAYALQDTEKWINEMVPRIWKEKEGCEFIILNRKEDRVLGACCLEQLDLKSKKANIGYWVRSSENGKGIATQACHFLLEFGFRELALESIRVIPSTENPASKRVAEKLPYNSLEKVSDGFQIRDNISDALVFTINAESYLKQKK